MTRGVLVVDDDPDYRLLVRLTLEGRGDLAVVGEAADAAAAVDMVRQLGPRLVLLDSGLAEGAALRMASRLAGGEEPPVVVLASARPGSEAPAPPGLGLPVVSKGLAPSALAAELDLLASTSRREDPGAETVSRSFPAALRSAAESRHLVAETLGSWGVDEDVVDTALLLTSELVTNAVVHAHSDIQVSVVRTGTPGAGEAGGNGAAPGGRIRVGVADRVPAVIRRRRASEEDQSGRGTELVEALSESWGVELRGTSKEVWFELRAGGEEN